MGKSILAAVALIAVFSMSAFAQATLETLMTHSVSSAVGTHAGTALGRATNALANRVAQQTPSATSHTSSAVYPSRRPGAPKTTQTVTTGATATPAATTGNGSLIASIQGGEPRAVNCMATPKGANSKNAGSQNSCAAATSHSADHPSVVNLPAAH
jgi:hypothetical protein